MAAATLLLRLHEGVQRRIGRCFDRGPPSCHRRRSHVECDAASWSGFAHLGRSMWRDVLDRRRLTCEGTRGQKRPAVPLTSQRPRGRSSTSRT